jgi:ABC-type sugar transport system ATPase subunit
MARIDLVDVCKTLREPAGGAHRSSFSIRDVTLRVPDGKTLVILGPSGCGKTTLLKIIAGLIPHDSGAVRYDDVDVKDVSPGERRIGMVFQNYALYPHMSSRTNVLSYFMFRRKTPELDELKRAKYERTSALMGVELTQLLDRRPTTLSGGEKQRVAMGRCITRDARLFLVDEPFANLDQALREKYRVNLKILLRQFSITTVYVTHDHHEALILAHLLAVMNEGRIEQVGTPEEIYDAPKNVFVAGFLNLHTGTPPIGLIDGPPSENVWIGVRPEDIEITPDGAIEGRVMETEGLPLANTVVATIRVGERDVHVRTSTERPLRVGDQVRLALKRQHVFDKASGLRLGTVD